jgi:hypothetical protein
MPAKAIPIIKIKKDLTIVIPMLPNYIRVVSAGSASESIIPIPVQEFQDAELQKLGKAWTNALIESAQKKRLQKHG